MRATCVAVMVFAFGCHGRQELTTPTNNPAPGSAGPATFALTANEGPREEPTEITYDNCPPEGEGGDPDLNLVKNRVDAPSSVNVTAFGDVIGIDATARKVKRAQWTTDERNAIDAYEGTPVQVEGYLAGAKEEGPETCNCKIDDTPDHDFHLYLVASAGADKSGSVIVEMAPRVRKDHPSWTVAKLKDLVSNGTRVRVSGWLMFDEEHPEGLGSWRATLWEVHPITAFEQQTSAGWQDL